MQLIEQKIMKNKKSNVYREIYKHEDKYLMIVKNDKASFDQIFKNWSDKLRIYNSLKKELNTFLKVYAK